jgi:hypothetical protein
VSPRKTAASKRPAEPVVVSSILTVRTTRSSVVEHRNKPPEEHQEVSVRREIIVDIDPKADLRYRSPRWSPGFSDTRAERVTVILVDDEPPEVRLGARSLLRKRRQGQRGALRMFRVQNFHLEALRTAEEGRFAWLPELVDRVDTLEVHHDA